MGVQTVVEFIDLVTLASKEGVFLVLFMFSFYFILRENTRREEHQRTLFTGLSSSLEKAKEAITSIEGKIERIDSAQTNISQDLMEVKYMIDNIENIIIAKGGNGSSKK